MTNPSLVLAKASPILAAALTLAAVTQAQTMQSDWQAKWAGARAYTLAVADAMPDSLYGFRPEGLAPRRALDADALKPAMTFGEQLLHLADNIRWLSASKLADGPRPPRAEVDPRDADAVRAYVDAAFGEGVSALARLTFADLDEEVDWFTGERLTRRRVGLLLFDHVTHHRAQAIVYLRLNGIAAPRYVGW